MAENNPPITITEEDIAAINLLNVQVFAIENQVEVLLQDFIEVVQVPPIVQVPVTVEVVTAAEADAINAAAERQLGRRGRLQRALLAQQPQPQPQQQQIDAISTEQQQQRQMLVDITQALQVLVNNTYVTEEIQELLEEVAEDVDQTLTNTVNIQQTLTQQNSSRVITQIFNFIKMMYAMLLQARDMINRFRPSRWLTGSGPIMTILRLIALFIELSIFLTLLKLFIEIFVYDGDTALIELAKGIANQVATLYVTVFNLLTTMGSPVFKMIKAFGQGLIENPQVKAHYDLIVDNLIRYLSNFKDFVMNATGLSTLLTFIETNNGLMGAAGTAAAAVKDTAAAAVIAVKDAVKDTASNVIDAASTASIGYLKEGLGVLAGFLTSRMSIAPPTNGRAIEFISDTYPSTYSTATTSAVYLEYVPTVPTDEVVHDTVIPVQLPATIIIPTPDPRFPSFSEKFADEFGPVFDPVTVTPLEDTAIVADTATIVADIAVLELDVLNFEPFEITDFEPFEITELQVGALVIDFNVIVTSFYTNSNPYPSAYPNPTPNKKQEGGSLKGGYYKYKKGQQKKKKQTEVTKVTKVTKVLSILKTIEQNMITKYKKIKTEHIDNLTNNLTGLLIVNVLNSNLSRIVVYSCEICLKLYIDKIIIVGKKAEETKYEKEVKTEGGKRKSRSRKYLRHKTHKRIRHKLYKNKKCSKRRYKIKRHSKRRNKK